jgi:hypothetical protein
MVLTRSHYLSHYLKLLIISCLDSSEPGLAYVILKNLPRALFKSLNRKQKNSLPLKIVIERTYKVRRFR